LCCIIQRRIKLLHQALLTIDEGALNDTTDLLNLLVRERQLLEERLRLLETDRNALTVGPGALEWYKKGLTELV